MPRSTRARRASAPARLPDGRAAGARGGRSSTGERLLGVQQAAGNSAVGRLLAGGPTIGRNDDPAEARADRHAAGHDGPGGRPGRVSLASAPRLGGGRPLPGHLLRRFAPRFRSDLRGVRLHTGRSVDNATRAMGAEAFTFGRDVFVRSDKYAPHTRSGRALLRHELAHVDAERGRGRMIRRKAGLPNAADATREGGTSGLGFMGKGEWGTYRGRLDKFRAVDDDKKARQAQLLLKLMDSSVKILASGYNTSKKSFVREQVPKIKKLYYEVALKTDVFDAIESEARSRDTEARKGVGKGITSRMERLRKAKQKQAWSKLDKEKRSKVRSWEMDVTMPTTPTIDNLLDRLEGSPVTMNFPPTALGFFIADSDVKQFWALKSDTLPDGVRKGPDYAKDRDAAEVMMGYKSMYKSNGTVDGLLRSHRPVSCGVNVVGNAKGAAPHYGRWHFRLKDSVKTRATYLSGDSMDQVNAKIQVKGDERAQHMGTQKYLASVLNENEWVMDALVLAETDERELATDFSSSEMRDGDWGTVTKKIAKDQYVEVQVHGGISIDDIEALVVDVPRFPRDRKGEDAIKEGALVDKWAKTYSGRSRVEYV